MLRAEPDIRLTVHCSGSLLAWLRERAAPTFDLLGTLAARGQVELLTGGFYEPVLPMLPDIDKVGQVQRLTEFLRASFGVTPRGMWLAERVWEPQLPRVLRAAGVEYVVVDDHHFALAGLDPETLGGYYLTEDQGAAVAVFPISERLRYLVPFAEPAETVAHLAARREAGSMTLVDDGEKFGVWPGTQSPRLRGGLAAPLPRRDPAGRPGFGSPPSREFSTLSRPGGACICRPRPTRRWASGRSPRPPPRRSRPRASGCARCPMAPASPDSCAAGPGGASS